MQDLSKIAVPSYAADAPVTETDETAKAQCPRLTITTKGQFKYEGELLPEATVNVVILAISPAENFVNHRSYWESEFGDNPGPPDCGSPDGVLPYDYINSPQAEACKGCPQTVSGSGGKGRSQACGSFKIAYCVFPENAKAGVFLVKVSITALKALGAYRHLIHTELNVPIAGVITKLFMDPESEYARLAFSFVSILPEKEFNYTTQLAASGKLKSMMVTDVSEPPKAIGHEPKTATPQLGNPEREAPAQAEAEPEKTPPPSSVAGLFGGVKKTVEPLPYNTIKELITAAADLESLTAALNTEKDLVARLTSDQVTAVQGLIAAKVEEWAAVTIPEMTSKQECFNLIHEATKASHLPDIVDTIEAVGEINDQEVKIAFITKANELNAVVWSPAVHGTSKRGGYPALTKAGLYCARRGASKPVATQEVNENVSKVNDILGALTKA